MESSGSSPAPIESGRWLLVASTGGHLTQLNLLRRRWALSEESVWVTFESEQSRSLLAGDRVIYVPYIPPRDVRGILHARRLINVELAGEEFDGVVSTGAALALAGFLSRPARSVRKIYVESVSRTEGPSLTGRLLQTWTRASSVELWTQHSAWAGGRWRAIPGVLAEYRGIQKTDRPSAASPRVFVTLGTIAPYRFDRLIDSLLKAGVVDSTTTWQLGSTWRDDLPGSVHVQMSDAEFTEAIESADVVVTHAGVGTILKLLDMGKFPVVVPRSKQHGEHVDDHQRYISTYCAEHQVAAVAEPQEITPDLILQASRAAVRPGP